MGALSQILYSVFRLGRRGLVPAPTADEVASRHVLCADGTWRFQGLAYFGSRAGNAVPDVADNPGDFVYISSGGTSWGVAYQEGDWAIWSGTPEVWSRRPGNIGPSASTSVAGFAQLATSEEAIAGSNTTKALTPAAGNARALYGDLLRATRPLPVSDGATSGRRMQQQPGAAGNLAGAEKACWVGYVFVPESNPATNAHIAVAASTASGMVGTANSISILFSTARVLRIDACAADFNNRRAVTAAFAARGGSFGLLEVRLTKGTASPVVFWNGVNISSEFSADNAGTPPEWLGTALAGTWHTFGTNWPAGYAPLGTWALGHLTDAESLTWAQTGVPPIWWQLGTGNVARFVSDMSSSTGWILTGTSSIAGGKLTIPNDASIAFFAGASGISGMTTGERRGFTVTVDSISGGGSLAYWNGTAYVPFANAPGTYTVEFTVLASYTSGPGLRISGGAGGEAVLDNYTARVFGPFAKSVAQPGCVVMSDSGENRVPTLLTPGLSVTGDLPETVAISSAPMTADGFVLADQTITPPGYKLVDAVATQTGTSTTTLTVRETSSGGTTVATGALSGSTASVDLTVSNGLLAAGKKLHVAAVSWTGLTVQIRFIFRRVR